MATYQLTMSGLANRAYRILGILPAGGSATDDQFEQALIAYNIMALGQQASGPSLFRLTQIVLTIPTGVGYAGNPFVITPQIVNMLDGRWVVTPAPNLYERPLGNYVYEDYMTLPNKREATGSGPSVYCLDKQATQSNLYLWPLPAFGGTLNATVARYVNPAALPSDALDFPPEWQEGLVYALANRLMDDEGVAAADQATAQRIQQKADQFTVLLENFDRPTSVMMRPYGKRGAGRFWRS